MIKQRVLYIGLGGSGIDLGLALDKALKHEICGLDGRQLLQRPGHEDRFKQREAEADGDRLLGGPRPVRRPPRRAGIGPRGRSDSEGGGDAQSHAPHRAERAAAAVLRPARPDHANLPHLQRRVHQDSRGAPADDGQLLPLV